MILDRILTHHFDHYETDPDVPVYIPDSEIYSGPYDRIVASVCRIAAFMNPDFDPESTGTGNRLADAVEAILAALNNEIQLPPDENQPFTPIDNVPMV